MLAFLGLLLLLLQQAAGESQDSNVNVNQTAAYLLQTRSLPKDRNYMPSLSNGHLGYTVFGDSIFMNGLYNGAAGESRRARLPNWLNITASVCDRFGCLNDDHDDQQSSYEMQLRDGYFRYNKTFPTLGLVLEQRSYAHRFYSRALVYELVARRHAMATRSYSPVWIRLSQRPGEDSEDLDFTNVNKTNQSYRMLHGKTKVLEFEPMQPSHHEIYVVFSEDLTQGVQLEWPTWQAELHYRLIITVDRQKQVAVTELTDALKLKGNALLMQHAQTWNAFWDKEFSIDIRGDLELWRTVNAGIFYLACALPSPTTNQPSDSFYGLSPTGLARGHTQSDYQGHSYWHTELWMLPAITQISVDWAKLVLNYRKMQLPGARYNAYAKGYKGARFPWASAYTGTEVTPRENALVARQQIHVSSDIVYGLQKFYAQMRNLTWACESAWPIAQEVAEFLVSRVACEEISEMCHLLGVMGPDGVKADVDDNAYTNSVAKIALKFAYFLGSNCGNDSIKAEALPRWQSVQQRLQVLHDAELDYHPQYLGYERNSQVQQADAILLGFPLYFDRSTSSTHLNDLDYYESVTNTSGSTITWSMFATNYLVSFDPTQAEKYFMLSYEPYVRSEFRVWGEEPIDSLTEGAVNFLPGIGGFLQALIHGYGGINFVMVDNEIRMVMNFPVMPLQVEQMTIKFISIFKDKCIYQFSDDDSGLDCSQGNSRSNDDLQHYELVKGEQRELKIGNLKVNMKKGDKPLHILFL